MKRPFRAKVRTLFPSGLIGRGPSYCCSSIGRGLDRLIADHATWFLRAKTTPPCRSALPVWPRLLNEVAFRIDRRRLRQRLEAMFLAEMTALAARGGVAVALLWPGVSFDLAEALQAAGAVTVFQAINTQLRRAKAILDAEHAAIGMPNLAAITEGDVERETTLLQVVDRVWVPTQEVAASMRAIGVSRDRILPAPFGWDPARFPNSGARRSDRGSFTALFVGHICVRKGAHLLLQAWAEADVGGKLVLCGRIEPTIQRRFGDLLARPDVTVLPLTDDIDAVYREADVFLLPTLEEGAPLVVYEAAGTGLPVVTTRMGACDMIRDQESGYVLDAHDKESWIQALRRLAASVELRRRLGEGASRAAATATWQRAADIRHAQLTQIAEETSVRRSS